jgi:hypothetical protein
MLWASGLALGNGGGYARGGATGGDVQGFEPVATERIRIVDEQLGEGAQAGQPIPQGG